MGHPMTIGMFMCKVEKRDDGCWNWLGTTSRQGYGKTKAYGRTWSTHRYAYTQLVGEIPEGLQLDHLCMNKRCVNPAHLEPVTAAENLRRRDVAYGIRTLLTHCPQGHPYDETNTARTPKGHRYCRTCKIEKGRAWRANNLEWARKLDREAAQRARDRAKAAA